MPDTKKPTELYEALDKLWNSFNFYEMKTDSQFEAMEKAAKMLYKYREQQVLKP